jgi:hypothetical protein
MNLREFSKELDSAVFLKEQSASTQRWTAVCVENVLKDCLAIDQIAIQRNSEHEEQEKKEAKRLNGLGRASCFTSHFTDCQYDH